MAVLDIKNVEFIVFYISNWTLKKVDPRVRIKRISKSTSFTMNMLRNVTFPMDSIFELKPMDFTLNHMSSQHAFDYLDFLITEGLKNTKRLTKWLSHW
jgi:hypothetical protein